MFFRESCFRQSGDKQRRTNPTHYRCALHGAQKHFTCPALSCGRDLSWISLSAGSAVRREGGDSSRACCIWCACKMFIKRGVQE